MKRKQNKVESDDSDVEKHDEIKIRKKKEKKEKRAKIDIVDAYNDTMEWIEEFKYKGDNEEKKYTCLPWVEKFRPKKLCDVVDHEIFISTLEEFIKKRQMSHLLLSGPPGTGKTSSVIS